MPKNIVQDVVPRSNRRSIRDIVLPNQHKISHVEKEEVVVRNDSENDTDGVREMHYNHKSEDTVSWSNGGSKLFSKWGIWLVGFISLLFLIFVAGNFFFGATVNLTAKTLKAKLDLNLTAKSSASVGELTYNPVYLSQEQEITIPADGEKTVETRASGKIIIYNNYTSATQRLIKNTRFETPDGLIYKINDSVIIPGMKTEGGKTTPGSIEVTVYAESAGQEYNIGLTDFTIPGFKNNPDRYAGFFARSKTVMSGGKVGKEKTVSETKFNKFKSQLESDIRSKLITEVTNTLPSDSIFYDQAYRVKFDKISSVSNSTKNTVTLKLKGEIVAFTFKKDALSQFVAESFLNKKDDSIFYISNLNKLSFKLSEKSKVDLNTSGPIQFSLIGDANIIWKIDTNKLASSLIGKHKNELSSVVGPDPAIIKAEAVIRPFWKNTFPSKVSKIKITVI